MTKSSRPLEVVGQLLIVVSRPPQVVSQDNKWSAMGRRGLHTKGGGDVADQKRWRKDQETQLSDQKIGWQRKKWLARRNTGLPPLDHLPNKENKVCTKNKPKRMQDERSGGKVRGRKPRKLVYQHQNWSATTKVVSRTTVSL